MENAKAIESLSFEEALSELERIVRSIDNGQENLEKAIQSFERGVSLKNYCDKKLKEAELKIEKIVKQSDNTTKLEPVEFE